MTSTKPDTNLAVLLREASAAASRLRRQLLLPLQEEDDLRQELLARSILRIRSYDPARGPFGAFVGRIMARQAAVLAGRIRRARAALAPMSLDAFSAHASDGIVGSGIAETDGYGAWLGQPTDAIAALERRLALRRALATLSRSDLALCIPLIENTPTELSRAGGGARASLYRRVRKIRLRLLVAGVDARG